MSLDVIDDELDIINDSDVDSIVAQTEEEEAIADRALLQIAFGDSVATAFESGDLTARYSKHAQSFITTLDDEQEAVSAITGVKLQHDPETLATTMEHSVHGVFLPAGSAIVMGVASVGKTPVLKWVVKACNDVNPGSATLFRYGEPLPGYITNEVDAARKLMVALLNPAIKVIAIDSIKDLVASMGGGLMARGVPRLVFKMISQWGTVAASLGKTIIVPLNISTDDQNAMDEVSSAVSSNATTAILYDRDGKYAVSARTGEGRLRANATWKLQFKDGKPVVTSTDTVQPVDIRESLVGKDRLAEAKISQTAILRTINRRLVNKD